LIIASYHFGKEDSQFVITKKRKFHDISFLLKGSIVVLAPLMFHTEETIKIFEILNVQLTLINKDILLPFIILSLLSNLLVVNFKEGHYAVYCDWITIIILNWFFDPLIAFTIYFCFLHSVRHSISLIYELNKNNFKKGLKEFIKKALPLTIITGVIYLIAVFFITNSYSLNDAILKVIFIGLASLTFPHILLEYLIEKNEQ
jgi:Brp/Blh family beta-carotene 15,15'-monooxygenase